jgi:fibronectin type 3 domain-containing protein
LGALAEAAMAQTVSYSDFGTGEPLPVFAGGGPGAWDEIVREKVWVLQEESGQYRMWYVGHTSAGQTTSKVGYATSPDGITWTRHPGNPVINRTVKDQDICVLRRADGVLNMYVEVNDDWIDLFTSNDGIAWTPHPANPLKTDAASPVVWQEGGNWYMLYENMASNPFTINLATSPDGVVWTDSAANPVLADSTHVVPDSVIKDGATYHLYYHRYENGWPGWHAVSTDATNWTQRTQLFAAGNYALSSQATLRAADGHIRAYLWSERENRYYLRYGVSRPGPTVWPLDEGSGLTTEDSSGHRARGALLNGVVWSAGHAGTALQFDGVNDHALLGHFAELPVWSVALWVRSPAPPASAPPSGPIHRHANYQINWNHPSGSGRGAVGLKVAGAFYAASFGPLQGNTWYHLVGTYDGETIRAYKNGVLVGTNTAPSGPPDPERMPLTLGRHAQMENYFSGTVDEPRVYGRVLSDAEVAALASGGPPPTPDTTPPSAPGGLVAASAGGGLALSWSPATDAESGVSLYRIYRATTSSPSKALVASVTAPATQFTDSGVQPNTTYYYHVTAVNGVGLEGPASNEASAQAPDIPPNPPGTPVVTAGDGLVSLDWPDNTDADLAGYRVYRGTTAGGPYARIGPDPIATSEYSDSSVINDTTYFYVVTALDTAGQESAPSSEVSARPAAVGPVVLLASWQLDEGTGTIAADDSGNGFTGTLRNGAAWAPGISNGGVAFDGVDDYISTNFTATPPTWTIAAWVRSPQAPANGAPSGPLHRNLGFQINWNHPDAAFRGTVALRVAHVWHAASYGVLDADTWYHLAATYDGETLRAFKNGVLVATNTAPSGPPDTDAASLKIARHAAAGNFFAGTVDDVRVYEGALEPAAVAALAAFDETPPSPPGALSASADGQAVSLIWEAASDPESGVNQYRIRRAETGGGPKSLVGEVPGSTLTFTDLATQPGTGYFYEVTAVNGAGLEGLASNEASTVTGDTAPAAPSGLSALGENSQVVLDWADNVESDLDGYRVYRSTVPDGGFVQVGPAVVTSSAFVDATTANDTTYYYVVSAVDDAGNESGFSTTVSATPTAIDTSLVAHWLFDENAGTLAADATGNGWTGTLRNGTLWTAGVSGSAVQFDGLDDNITTTFGQDLAAFTVAVWVRSPAAPAAAAASGPVSRNSNFQINWNHSDSTFRGAVAIRVGAWHAASFGALEADRWYHLTATYDGETLRAYRDGVLMSVNTNPSGPPNPDTSMLRMGRQATAGNFFQGVADDVRVYNRALAESEVAALGGAPNP